MSVSRKNTLVIDFNILPQRPDAAKVHKFLEEEIKLQFMETENIQLHNIKNCVYVEVKDSETAARYQRLHNNMHMVYHGENGFKIPVYVESEAVPVRVHDLPPAMKHTTVIKFLETYGEVQSVTRERWKKFFPGVYNGVRVLHMKLKQPIPSVVTIAGHSTLITYPGQPRICPKCLESAHPKQKCTKSPMITTKSNNITLPISTRNSTAAPESTNTNTFSSSEANLLNATDFPPIVNEHRLPQTISIPTVSPQVAVVHNPQQNNINSCDEVKINDDDNEDDGGSSSSHETNESTNKRRLLTKEEKKMRSSQGSHIANQSNIDRRMKKSGGETILEQKKFKRDVSKK